MTLQRLSIVNYKNIREALLEFSPKINCFIGDNGAGKTNVLDAIYFLSFCRSVQTTLDSQSRSSCLRVIMLPMVPLSRPCSSIVA